MAAFQDYAGLVGNTPGGHYRLGFKTGATIGYTANQAFFCWRWTQQALFARLLKLRVTAVIKTAFTTAQTTDIAMWRATGWTVAPTAGVSLTNVLNGEDAMADAGVTTGMANLAQICPLAATNFAVANTAALTQGTLTLDGNPLAYDVLNIIALGSSDKVTLYDVAWGNEYPLTLSNNEGVVLTIPTAQGAVGSVAWYIDLTFCVNNAAF